MRRSGARGESTPANNRCKSRVTGRRAPERTYMNVRQVACEHRGGRKSRQSGGAWACDDSSVEDSLGDPDSGEILPGSDADPMVGGDVTPGGYEARRNAEAAHLFGSDSDLECAAGSADPPVMPRGARLPWDADVVSEGGGGPCGSHSFMHDTSGASTSTRIFVRIMYMEKDFDRTLSWPSHKTLQALHEDVALHLGLGL